MFLNRSYSHMDVLTKASITIHVIEDVAIYKAQIFSSNGNIFGINDRETEIHLVVWKGLEDITSRFNDIVWRRFTSKESGYEEDLAWGDKYRNKTSFTLTREDINERAKIQVEVYGPVNGERKLVAVDYINFIDVNDLQGSQTPPSNPKDGELWLDTSVTPPRLMMWDAKLQMWVEITVAGKDRRNLIRNSNFYKATFDHWVTTNNPVIEIKSLNAKKWARLKARTGKDKICGIRQTISNVNTKSKYTFQMLSEVYIQSSAPEGNALVALYSIDKQNKKTLLKEELFDITTDARTYSSTFTTLESTEAVEVNIGGQKQVPFDFLVTDIKLANYPVATEWELAIEDIQDALNNKLENSHEEVFNSLTDNGQMQGMYVDIDEQGRKNFYFNASYIKSGKLLGEFIEGRNLTVKDNSGNKTLEITSNGEINIKAKSLSIGSSSVATNNYVNNAVENVQFGGRNLIKQSKLLSNVISSGWNIVDTGNEGFKKLEINTTNTSWQECSIPLYSEINTLTSSLTMSFEYQESMSGLLAFNFGVYNSSGARIIELVNWDNANFKVLATRSGWKYVSITFDPSSINDKTNADHYRVQFKKVNGKTGRIQVRKPMLEISTKASSWNPAPEDFDSAINRTIKTVDVMYYSSTSSSTVTGGSWQTLAPAWQKDRYIWTKTVTTYMNNTSSETTPVCISGINGQDGTNGINGTNGTNGTNGAPGQGIVSITEEYYLSSSKTAQVDGAWVTTPPTWSFGKYIWTRSKIVYKNPTSTAYTTPICDSSWEAVNEIQIGGRNLLWNSGFKKGITYWEVHACNNAAAITDSTALSGYAFKFTSTGDGGLYQRKSSGYYPSGTILTVSGYVKCSVAGKSFDVNFENAGSSNTFKRTTCTNKDTWYYFTYTYTVSWNTFNTVTFYGQTGADYYVKDLMLEYGNKASTWVEAPEDVNQAIEEVKTKTSEIKSSVDGITANVTTIKTQTDMSTNPMTLVAKPNFSAYETENEGEVFLHGLDNNRNPANVDGKCIWNNQLVALPKVMFNPNKIVADGIPIYMVRNIADKKWWSIWKETDEAGTVSWKRVLANSSTDTTVYSHTWNEANDIVVGYYIIKKTEPRNSEAPISIAQLFNGALSYKQAQSMSLVSSISQFDILEDKIDLKVQKNNVISSINLYTQENENGTTSGVKIQGDKIDLQGQVTFSSLADNDVSGSIKDIFTQQNNKTVINGGMIQTQSIKGDDLLLKGNLTVSKTVDNKIVNTFAIKENGDIEIDGLLKSANFSESLNTGYKISTDGTAIFNQAQIKGDVILARAGMTNYGGPIGNENLIRNSNFTNALNYWTIHDLASKAGTSKSVSVLDGGDWCPPGMKVLQIRGTNTTDRYGVISQSFNLTAGVKYTISGYCAGHRITKLQVNVRNMDASSANIHTVNYNPVVGGTSLSKWTFFKTTFTASANAKHALNLYATAMQSDGYAWFADVKLEAGEVATPWCPHTLDQDGHVRIWAGSEYDKRDNAPFRVYQNGDIFATNGIFSGRVLGHIDSGNIHIDNGEFVINSTSTYMHNNKILSINKTRDIHPNPYIKFSSTENFINTDLSFGTINDKRLFYNNNNRELTSNISFIQNNSWGSIISNKDVVDGSTVKGFTIIDASNRDGGKHRIKYWKEYTGMIFESYGARHNPNNEQPYDFKFERLDGLVNVKVQGNIELTNSIQGSNQNIQLRSVANEGWGFFVI